MNKSKAKGTRAETAIVNWLTEKGLKAKRKPLAGALDMGDIEIEGYALVLQSKWTTATPTAGMLDDWLAVTLDQAANCSFANKHGNTFFLPVLVHNRQRCTDPAKWIWYCWSARHRGYIRFDGEGFLRWLEDVKEGEELI